MMPPFIVFPTNRIAHFVEVSLYLFYLAQQVNLEKCYGIFHCKGDEAVLEKNAYPVGQQDRRWS